MSRTLTPHSGEEYGRSLSHIRRALILLTSGVAILTLLAASWSLWRSYREHRDTSQHTLQTLALTLEEHTRHTLDNTVFALESLAQNAEFQTCLGSTDKTCLHDILTRAAVRHPQLATLTLLSANGQYLASNLAIDLPEISFANDDYFLAHSAPMKPTPFIGERRLDPVGQIEIIPLSVPCVLHDSQGAGILVAGLNPIFFEQFQHDLIRRHPANALLIHQKNHMLAQGSRTPHARLAWPTMLEEQHQTTQPNPQGGLTLWRKVENWPLAIAIEQPPFTLGNFWREENLLILVAALFAILSGLFLLWYVLRLLRRQEKIESDLYLTKAAVERGADMAIWLDRHSAIHYVNTTACHRLGYSEQELLRMNLKDIFPSFHLESWPMFWNRLCDHKHLFDEVALHTRSGEEFPAEIYSSFIVFKGQEYNCAVVRDISERRQAETATQKREDQLRLALEASNTGLFDMPLDGHGRANTSPEYDRLLGFEPGSLNESFENWKEQLHIADRDAALAAYHDYYVGKSPQFVIEYRRKHRSGSYRWFQSRGRFIDFDAKGQPKRLIGTVTDITERKLAESRIAELANLDAVTGLANRNLLRDELSAALVSASRQKRRLAILFLDLDRFKTINDSLGHAAGDAILAQVAGRLRQNVGKTDILARLGGDEFVVVLTDIANPMEAGDIAERLLAGFVEPFRLDVGEFAATISIGISIYPDDSHDTETLIRSADVAMYQAKAAGRNNYQFFTADMNTRATERLTLETGLRQSITNHEFELMFQPQVSLESGRIIGVEALLRWHHPELGLIPPGKFIPVAEESRIIIHIGNWVLREACQIAANWRLRGLPSIIMAVNLSPLQLHQANLLDLVQQALNDTGLPPASLELELTESVVMQEGEHVMGMLAGLKQLGVRLSIDDFGTGYSSLSYLKRFDFDKIKIDQSFIRDIHRDPNDTAIVLAIIGLGKTLGMSVLAEGVETREQLDFLYHAKADAIQGYFFSKALNNHDFIELMQSNPLLTASGATE